MITSYSDQTCLGIALALVGIVRQSTLSLYQFHLIYDTINLTRLVVLLLATLAIYTYRSNLD